MFGGGDLTCAHNESKRVGEREMQCVRKRELDAWWG
jgi:hypothetical protein